ncbi:hypothetical protein ACWDV4_29670 [Micromonospora sp. NPDC003197]
MWDSQNAILAILAGGQPAIVKRTESSMADARQNISDSTVLLTEASNTIAGYRTRF